MPKRKSHHHHSEMHHLLEDYLKLSDGDTMDILQYTAYDVAKKEAEMLQSHHLLDHLSPAERLQRSTDRQHFFLNQLIDTHFNKNTNIKKEASSADEACSTNGGSTKVVHSGKKSKYKMMIKDERPVKTDSTGSQTGGIKLQLHISPYSKNPTIIKPSNSTAPHPHTVIIHSNPPVQPHSSTYVKEPRVSPLLLSKLPGSPHSYTCFRLSATSGDHSKPHDPHVVTSQPPSVKLISRIFPTPVDFRPTPHYSLLTSNEKPSSVGTLPEESANSSTPPPPLLFREDDVCSSMSGLSDSRGDRDVPQLCSQQGLSTLDGTVS